MDEIGIQYVDHNDDMIYYYREYLVNKETEITKLLIKYVTKDLKNIILEYIDDFKEWDSNDLFNEVIDNNELDIDTEIESWKEKQLEEEKMEEKKLEEEITKEINNYKKKIKKKLKECNKFKGNADAKMREYNILNEKMKNKIKILDILREKCKKKYN
jgi:hypothetical protein